MGKQCVVGIKGQAPEHEVDVWFDSLRSVASLLSTENQALLKSISGNESKTLTDVARQTGRAVSNLSRTLKHLQQHGLVTLVSQNNCLIPRAKYVDFIIVIKNDC